MQTATATHTTTLIAPSMHEGELRILDTDLAKRLGFDRPRNIRNLIKRYGADLDKMGPRFTVERVINGGTATETYLNKKQAIFITAKSETAEATEITIEIIEKFDAYERGAITQQPKLSDRQNKVIAILRAAEEEAAALIRKRTDDAVLIMQGHDDLVTVPQMPPKLTPKALREAAGMFRSLQYINKLSGMDKNNALLSANRQVRDATGIDLLKNSGATHLLAHTTDHPLTPTAIGKRLGEYGAQRINGVLAHLGLQTKKSVGSKDAWVPTTKGEPFAIMEDTGKKSGDGTPVRQLKWRASVIDLVRGELSSPVAA